MMGTKKLPHGQMIQDFAYLRTMSRLQLHLNLLLGLLMRKHVAVITRIPHCLRVGNF